MKHRFSKLIAACLFCGAALVSTAHADVASDRAQVERIEQTWLASGMSNDPRIVDAILHPDFLLVTDTGSIQEKSDVVMGHKPGQSMQQRFTSMAIRIYGDTAIVNGVCEYQLSPKAPLQHSTFTDVFVRGGPMGWQAVSSQGTPQR
ncbi:nuclear transport factor 2 family protein [Paraburkholderia sp. Ac-20340]|uniref:nuclear transport factor 2 family protein n=1 Tax=Paraburkholderia sp. Ac-20340 TaxID=2703888 RepID=UPI0019826E9C|nr:nuclear transport factor 2 family protein [Paraburkholderia sp. Ac-20340]MBN3852765.1 nuclear transport factor 2 family protein [Paraburkholderia sp. Ac-20340]